AAKDRLSKCVAATTEVNAPAPLTNIAVRNSKTSSAHDVHAVAVCIALASLRRKAEYNRPNSTPMGAIKPQPGVSLSNTAAVCGADSPYSTIATTTIQYGTLPAIISR